MSLADDVGRIAISQTLCIKLVAAAPAPVKGDHERAIAIGKGLVREAMTVLVAAAEAEGFKVTVDVVSSTAC